MNIKYFFTLFLAAACLFLSTSLTSPKIAHADMSALYDQAMINVNSARTINSGGRRGFSLGGAGFRAELVNPNVLNMVLPSLTSGCGGIDFYGGSFSMINSDQLVQAMRGVMQGSASYVFGLALSSICPTCKELATQLQKKMQQINDMARNACKAATDKLGELNEKDPLFGERDMILSGDMKATMAGWKTNIGATDLSWGMYADDTASSSENTLEAGKDLSGNVTWKYINEAKVDDWTHALGGLDLREILMSMLGNDHFVAGSSAAGSSTAVADSYIEEKPILKVEDFFGGVKGATGNITYWECTNKSTGTINSQCGGNQLVQTTVVWKGLVEMLTDDFTVVLNEMKDASIVEFTNPDKVRLLRYLSAVPNLQKLLVDSDSSITDIANILAITASRELIPKSIRALKHAISVVIDNPNIPSELRTQAGRFKIRVTAFNEDVYVYLRKFDRDVESLKDISLIVSFLEKKD